MNPLLDGCLALIGREEAFLARLHEGLRRLQVVLAHFDLESQAEAQRLQQELARAAMTMRQERQEWRAQAGRLLNMPAENVTLSTVAEALGPAGTPVRTARERLRRLAEEALQLNLSGAVLLRTYLFFLQRFFQELTGSGAASGRYDRAGVTAVPNYGSILKAQV